MTTVLRNSTLNICAGALLVASAGLAACEATPIVLSSQFMPPRGTVWPPMQNARANVRASAACPIHLAEIRDLRSDTQAMGSVNNRPVRATDTIAWVRSGFESLSRDARIKLIDGSTEDNSALVLHIELINAYVMPVTSETRTANIVVRVRYEREGAAQQEQIYRGAHNALTWGNGETETQASFDTALAELLTAVDRDVVARCPAAVAAGAN